MRTAMTAISTMPTSPPTTPPIIIAVASYDLASEANRKQT